MQGSFLNGIRKINIRYLEVIMYKDLRKLEGTFNKMKQHLAGWDGLKLSSVRANATKTKHILFTFNFLLQNTFIYILGLAVHNKKINCILSTVP